MMIGLREALTLWLSSTSTKDGCSVLCFHLECRLLAFGTDTLAGSFGLGLCLGHCLLVLQLSALVFQPASLGPWTSRTDPLVFQVDSLAS